MTKTTTTISLDVEVKEKACEILGPNNLSPYINDCLKELIKKEESKI